MIHASPSRVRADASGAAMRPRRKLLERGSSYRDFTEFQAFV